MFDYLASTTDTNGQPLQALGLSFYGQGLAAGGVLNFSLNFDKAIVNGNPPQIPQYHGLDLDDVSRFRSISDQVDRTTITSQGAARIRSRPPPIFVQGRGVDGGEFPSPCRCWLWSALAGAGCSRPADWSLVDLYCHRSPRTSQDGSRCGKRFF